MTGEAAQCDSVVAETTRYADLPPNNMPDGRAHVQRIRCKRQSRTACCCRRSRHLRRMLQLPLTPPVPRLSQLPTSARRAACAPNPNAVHCAHNADNVDVCSRPRRQVSSNKESAQFAQGVRQVHDVRQWTFDL